MLPGSPAKAGRLAGVVVVLALGATVSVAAAGAVYPLRQSPDRRYLVDQNGTPFLVMGDSPQALLVNLSEAEADAFCAVRRAQGFNTLWFNLLCTSATGGRADGSMLDGTLPFTASIPGTATYDLRTPNATYFAHVDRVLAMAASHGLLVLLDPIETSGWLSTMLDNGVSACREYGRFLGSRYRDVGNIVWMSGNDFLGWRDADNDAVVHEVALGILDYDTRHLHTTELDYPVSSSLDDDRWESILGLNATYTYFPTYARLRQDYNRSNFLPTVMVEANYEFENLWGPLTTPPILRKQEYWTMTSGAGGQLYGNGNIWPFLPGWQAYLDTPGTIQFGYLKTFFEPRAWYALAPDTTHVVVTAGYGTFADNTHVADNDYLTAACTANGALVVVYTPVVRTFTVDMSKLAAAVTARWYDPSSGTYVPVPGSPFPNIGFHDFAPPGSNADGDGGWVLALETQPPESQPPMVSLTAPRANAIVASTVMVVATASDNVGVAGVQFWVDRAPIGAELGSTPYARAWDTAGVLNGPHVLRAIARDAAGNRSQDSVTVTVQNTYPPVSSDQLVAAYAFDENGGATASDLSGNENVARVEGAAFGPGHHGAAVVFDGAGGYLEAANSASLDIGGTGLTIAFWINVHSTTSGVDHVIVGKPWDATTMVAPYYQYGVEYSNARTKTVDFLFGDAAGSLHGPHRMGIASAVWVHVAFTYDGTVVRGFRDGVESLSSADAGSLQPRGHSLRLGVDAVYQQPFDGVLDDLRIYGRALSPAEIQSVLHTPVGGSTASVHPGGDGLPFDLALGARGPNPTGHGASISFTLPSSMPVTLRVLDVAGRLVRRIELGPLSAGRQVVQWNGADAHGRPVASGRYFVHLQAGGLRRTTSVLLLR